MAVPCFFLLKSVDIVHKACYYTNELKKPRFLKGMVYMAVPCFFVFCLFPGHAFMKKFTISISGNKLAPHPDIRQ